MTSILEKLENVVLQSEGSRVENSHTYQFAGILDKS